METVSRSEVCRDACHGCLPAVLLKPPKILLTFLSAISVLPQDPNSGNLIKGSAGLPSGLAMSVKHKRNKPHFHPPSRFSGGPYQRYGSAFEAELVSRAKRLYWCIQDGRMCIICWQNSLMVQWLRLRVLTAKGPDSIAGGGRKILQFHSV